MKTTFIYFLKDPENPNKGYVGKADDATERLRIHLVGDKRSSCRRENWIRFLKAKGLKPRLEILDEVPFEYWKQWEVAYIEFFLEQGFDLVNGTPGGDGTGSGKYHPQFGKKLSAETKAKISAGNKGLKKPSDFGEKISARQLGEKNHRYGKPATMGFLGQKHSEEAKKKMAEGSAIWRETHDHPQLGKQGTFLGKKHSAETKEKMRLFRTGTKPTTETKEKISAAGFRMAAIARNSGRLPKNCKISISVF